MNKETTVTIDGQKYNLSSFSKQTKTALINLRITDEEIKRLKMQLGIAQTARATFAERVKTSLPAANKAN